jgi:inner membrane transporter RhtA
VAQAARAINAPLALLAGAGVGVCSSVIPCVSDQLAMARLTRAAYSLVVSLLPATATVVGVIVLAQIPTAAQVAGVALVVCAVALHHERKALHTA